MKRVNTIPWITGEMSLDWPVKPFQNYNTAERKRVCEQGIMIHLSPGRYVIARRITKSEYQIWGAAGTYSHGFPLPQTLPTHC